MKFKRLLACTALAAVLLSFAACRQKPAGTTPSQTAAPSETETAASSVHETTLPETASQTETETAAATELQTEPVSAQTTQIAAPQDTAQILAVYNDAINRTVDRIASFTKTRQTDAEKYEAPPILDTFKPLVQDFMGIDQKTQTRVTAKSAKDDPYDHYLQHASLREADVNRAECTIGDDGNYHITLRIKDGESHVAPDRDECFAPLDRCGIAVGEKDKEYWDHKTAQNVAVPLREYAKKVKVDEQYDQARIVAVIRPDGTPQRVEIRFHIAFELADLYGLSGSASGSTVIVYSDFAFPSP